MSDAIPFYFPGSIYHDNKKQLDELFANHCIEYDADLKAWTSDTCKVVGIFNGYKRPALLTISGDTAFIDDMKSFANIVGAEIKDVEVRDIRKVRNRQIDEKRIKDEAKKIAFVKAEKERLEGIESVIGCKLFKMKNLTPVFKRDWIFRETGVDISERLGIEPCKNVKKIEPFKRDSMAEIDEEEVGVKPSKKIKPKVAKPGNKRKVKSVDKPVEKKPTGISLLCKMGQHEACGGYMCACGCHNK